MKSLEFWFKKYVRQLPYSMVTLSPGDYKMSTVSPSSEREEQWRSLNCK